MIVIAAVLLAGIGAFALWPVDEEDRVRNAVRGAVRAFSEGHITDCLDAIDADFVDRSAGRTIDRDTIRAAMLGAFGRRRDGPTWIARLSADEVTLVELEAEAGRALTSFTVRTFELPPGAEYVDDAEPVWEVAVEARLARGEDGTWRFVASTHRTVSGTPPYR